MSIIIKMIDVPSHQEIVREWGKTHSTLSEREREMFLNELREIVEQHHQEQLQKPKLVRVFQNIKGMIYEKMYINLYCYYFNPVHFVRYHSVKDILRTA